MESSRWGSLLVRAAIQRLLNFDEGCPLTLKYAIKESLLINELQKLELAKLYENIIHVNIAKAQILTRSTGDAVDYRLFDYFYNTAMMTFNKIGKMLYPWDDSWDTRIKQNKEGLEATTHRLGESGLTEPGLVKMIKDYEEAKAEYQAIKKPTNEPARPTSTN